MSDICAYGCEQPARFWLKNGNGCCSKSPNSCPAKRARFRKSSPLDWEEDLTVECPDCGALYQQRRRSIRARELAKVPLTCSACSNSRASCEKWAVYSEETKSHILDSLHDGVRAYCARLTPEERAERGRYAGSQNTSYSVERQWESIRSDPDRLKALRESRSEKMKAVWASYSEGERDERILAALGDRKTSLSSQEFLDQVEAEGLTLKREVPISGFVVDGLHPATKTVIAFHGDFWHCNPKEYKDPDQYCGWLGRTVGEQQKRDQRRLACFYSLGYTVVVVWESDWIASPETQVQRVVAEIGHEELPLNLQADHSE